MNLTPMGNRIVIKPEETEKKTATGIIIPDTASKARPKTGKVVFVGKGTTDSKGKLVPMQVKKGDNVIFTEWAGTEIMIEGEKHLIMKEDEVLAVE
ncbi:MAG: co-chaperone GroES [Candidatus Riflebacteria bacterium HGW-Riflebacteria-2]|jgi:chaperonin GroES|nr:MAG: co-chaperone GroES [Candidatus Riflebacteria bacterium HGW-Riflebacteria-2]